MRAFAIVLLLAGSAAAQQTPSGKEPTSEDDTIRRELDELRAHQRWLEQRLSASEARQTASEAQKSAAQKSAASPKPPPQLPPPPVVPPPPDSSPRFHWGRGGFVFGTADGKTELRVRATFNLDGHAYFGDVNPLPDTFILRRARPFIEGTLWDTIDFRLMPDFAYGQATILDAYVDLRPWHWLRLRGGRFMIPVGLEWMQKDTTTHFLERSLATDLVPYRDLGLMLFGDFADGTFFYQLAFGNGAADSGNGPDFDNQSGKDYIGRLFIRPLRRLQRAAAITDLGFGVGASYGNAKGNSGAPGLATYKSTSLQPIFTYLTSTTLPATAATAATIADGDRWRVSPQLYWYIGPVGLLTEYVVSAQRVSRMDASATLEHRAWNVTLSFVLTMERAAFDGVVPRHPFDFHRGYGAFELVLRYSELRFDANAFPLFADPTASVSSAREFAGGLTWHLTDYAKVMMSFHRTDFTGGSPTGDREPENALIARLQLAL
jgi:phosphate-selective porin OprO and OprP